MREENRKRRLVFEKTTRNRIRPIFTEHRQQTSSAVPLVLFAGAGSEPIRGWGAVVLGRLIVSTIFSCFLVPALFSLMLDVRASLGAD